MKAALVIFNLNGPPSSANLRHFPGFSPCATSHWRRSQRVVVPRVPQDAGRGRAAIAAIAASAAGPVASGDNKTPRISRDSASPPRDVLGAVVGKVGGLPISLRGSRND